MKRFVFLLLLFASIEALSAEEGFEDRKKRKVGTLVEDCALFFMRRLQETEGKIEKTKTHKLLYFMNGMNYALREDPIIPVPFEAHQYGPIQNEVQINFDMLLPRVKDSGLLLDMTDDLTKSIVEVTFELFGSYTAGQLSAMTHEAGTPWSETRKRWEIPHRGVTDMTIPADLDREYFRFPKTINQLFLDPYVKGTIPRNDHSCMILGRLLGGNPSLVDDYISERLSSLEDQVEGLQLGRGTSSAAGGSPMVYDIEESTILLRDQVQRFVEQTKGLKVYDDIFRPYIRRFFVHTEISEGIVAEALYPFDFIYDGEVDLFFDASFRQLTALAAGFNSLPALYYLGRIFETFEEEGSSSYKEEVNEYLGTVASKVLSNPMGDGWAHAYEKVLASFYKDSPDLGLIDHALGIKTLPERYRKDILKRGFSYTGEEKYITYALERGYPEFWVLKASNCPEGEVFSYLEKGVQAEVPEAFFEAGKAILRHHYTVVKESVLWEKFSIEVGDVVSEEENKNLGEILLKKAIEKNVQPALILLIDIYGDDFDKALAACDLVEGKPWALYQKAKIREKQYRVKDSIQLYKASGPLLGYVDAIRLETPKQAENLTEEMNTFKKRAFESLYEDFKREYMG